MSKKIYIFLLFLPFFAFSQINLKVIDKNGVGISAAKILYNSSEFTTDAGGFVKIPLASKFEVLSIQKEGYTSFTKNINPSPKVQNLNVYLALSTKENDIQEVIFQKKAKAKITDLTSVELSPKEAQQIASISGGIEGLLKTLPSVNSNSELSSQYMVRGGNFDENLIYINDIEIPRPTLIRNSLQEGLSTINPDMVSSVNFSAGGFEAKYGDKMSSSLNIYYRQPTKFEVSGEASLIGERLTTGFTTKNKKLSALFSARYRNTDLVLKTLNEDTDFNPQYQDFQSFITYNFAPKWSISFLGYYSKNDFELIPKRKEVDFGTLLQPIKLNIGYGGRENDRYKNLLGNAAVTFKPTKKWKISLNTFAFQNREKEYYDIASAYELQTFDPVTGDPITSYDVGGQIDHARNDLLIKTYGAQLKTKFSPDLNTDFEVGLKYQKENIQDFTNEFQLVDSIGYQVPRDFTLPGVLDGSPLKLKYAINGQNQIEPIRTEAYAQFSKKLFWGENKIFVNAGARFAHWSFNNETLISPRFQFAIKPNWEMDMLFKLSGGIYYQAPFYKEIKDLDGNFNSEIKSQKSLQIILANEYEFKLVDRPFKLSTEAYYKKLSDLIPYFQDNVRIRYAGINNAKGYAYGLDARLYGEFVPGIDSWISASYARVFENINNQGNIPRPTDQRFRFALFYQDYMPKFPSMRVNLALTYANGLPDGAPVAFNAAGLPDFNYRYKYQRRLPSYKRVDIGLSKVFIDQKNNKVVGRFWGNFKELILGVQIFNAFNINNTVANTSITDVNSGLIYPVPVRLTGRFFNVKVEFKL